MKKVRHIWNILMGGEYMPYNILQPEVIVFAGPNGSEKQLLPKWLKQLVST